MAGMGAVGLICSEIGYRIDCGWWMVKPDC